MRCRAIAALSLVISARAQAQARVGSIVVELRDTAGVDSLTRGSVCATTRDGVHCALTRSGKRFTITALPLGVARVAASCDEANGFPRKALGQRAVEIVDSVPLTVALDVSFAGCGPGPLHRVVGTFRGHFTSAFEESSFSPCERPEWLTTDRGTRIWLEFTSRAWGDVKKPKAGEIFIPGENGRRELLQGFDAYFLRAHGVLEGPGSYGHMGGSNFRFTVDSIVAIWTPGRDDCTTHGRSKE
jgi:hypothetical protein